MDLVVIEEMFPFLKHCASKPLTLADLSVGDVFIRFPMDGDDSGHGGFKGGARLFVKQEPRHPGEGYHESFLYTCRPLDRPHQETQCPLWFPVLRIYGISSPAESR